MKVVSINTATNELTVERGIYGSYTWKHSSGTPIFKTLNFIRSRYIKLFEAFRGADYNNEKRLIWTGLIDDMTLEPNTNVFSLECKSTTTLVHRKILEKQYEGYLATDMLGADDEHALELKYADITIRPIENYNWLAADSYVYVKIDDEIIEAKRFSITHTFKVLRRGDDWGEGHPFFSEWKSHAIFATCRFLFPTSQELETFFKFNGVKSDHPIDILLALLLSTGDGDNYSGTGTNYDVLPAHLGLKIRHEIIDIDKFESMRDSVFLGMRLPNLLFGYDDEAIEAEEFIQKEILIPLMAVLFTNKDGKLSIATRNPDLIGEDLQQLDAKRDVIDFNYVSTHKEKIHKVTIRYDYSWAQGEFKQTRSFVSDFNKDIFIYEENEKVYEFKGINRIWGGIFRILINRVLSLIWRYEKPKLQLNLTTDFGKRLIDLGSNLFYSDDFSFDNFAGKRGFKNVSFVVEERVLNLARGTVNLNILRNPPGKYAKIAPSGLVQSWDGINLIVTIAASEFSPSDIENFAVGDCVQFFSNDGVEKSDNLVKITGVSKATNEIKLDVTPSPNVPSVGDIISFLKYDLNTTGRMKQYVAFADIEKAIGPQRDKAYNYLS